MKEKTIQVRVNEEEYAVMVQCAEKDGMVFSEWIRQRLRGSLIESVEPDAFRSDAPIGPVVNESVKGEVVVGRQKINKKALDKLKPGTSVDQWGNKRNLAKPGKK